MTFINKIQILYILSTKKKSIIGALEEKNSMFKAVNKRLITHIIVINHMPFLPWNA